MSGAGRVEFAYAAMHSANRELASTLRAGGHNGVAATALLVTHGEALYDFITLMLGPGDLAARALTDTAIAATSLAGRLREEEMLPAWLFALARHECRRHPPVVWRERHWQDLRRLARGGRVVQGAPLPAKVVRMAVLGLAPRDREVLVLASTRFKLLSRDLAAILEMSPEDAIGSAATAQENFEQALALCARTVGYRRDPRNRPPEIGELIGMVLGGIRPPLPSRRIIHACQARELAAYRRDVKSRIDLGGPDGFPRRSGPINQHPIVPSHAEVRALNPSPPRRMVVPAYAEERPPGAQFTRQMPAGPVSSGPGAYGPAARHTPPREPHRRDRHEWDHPDRAGAEPANAVRAIAH
jgi:DNA-directed RNA polymerase specialized sigma24 family protein